MPEPLPTFDDAVISGVTRHMNEDHADDTLLIARALGARPGATDARMIGLDNDGGEVESRLIDLGRFRNPLAKKK